MTNPILPAGLAPGLFASLVLTSDSIDYADQFITKTFPNISKFPDKLKLLSEFFNFKMIDRYVPPGRTDEEIAESDYWFTLQHLLNKTKVVGVDNVIKSNIQA
jgi:hypothetical protein